jgi:hypothetical protein
MEHIRKLTSHIEFVQNIFGSEDALPSDFATTHAWRELDRGTLTQEQAVAVLPERSTVYFFRNNSSSSLISAGLVKITSEDFCKNFRTNFSQYQKVSKFCETSKTRTHSSCIFSRTFKQVITSRSGFVFQFAGIQRAYREQGQSDEEVRLFCVIRRSGVLLRCARKQTGAGDLQVLLDFISSFSSVALHL